MPYVHSLHGVPVCDMTREQLVEAVNTLALIVEQQRAAAFPSQFRIDWRRGINETPQQPWAYHAST